MAKYKKNELKNTNALGVKYANNPSPKLAEELLEAFGPFIEKYLTLLSPDRQVGYTERVGLTKETKSFLYLFKKANESCGSNIQDYYTIMKRLPNMAKQALLTNEDLKQSLILIFLELANRFNPDIGTFTGYINKFFKYEVRTLVFKSFNDAAKYQPKHHEPIEDFVFFGYDVEYEDGQAKIHVGHELVGDTIVDKCIDIPQLSLSFISSPKPPFDTLLTKQERIVMIKLLVECKSASAAADDLDYSNATTIRNMWDSAIQKIRTHFDVQLEGEPQC